jgi:hypothetical protein
MQSFDLGINILGAQAVVFARNCGSCDDADPEDNENGLNRHGFLHIANKFARFV